MKTLPILAVGTSLLSAPVLADWHFRGTPNQWHASSMTPIDTNHVQTCQQFQQGDATGGPRFKIDHYGDWAESYPVADFTVAGNQSYRIDFYTDSQTIQTTPVADCESPSYAQTFPQLYFRGTPNAWDPTAMTLVDHHTWSLLMDFDGQTNQRFKFDLTGDWSQNYGDDQRDGVLDASGEDIFTPIQGEYLVTVNDQTLAYSMTPVNPCTSDCDEPMMLGASYQPEQTTFSIWSPETRDVTVTVNGTVYPLTKVSDFNGYTDVYQAVVPGDLHLAEYTFRINGIPVRDPYGKMAEPGTGDDRAVNIVMDMSRTEPIGGWAARPALVNREDAVIYEVHVRDFTLDDSAGVSSGKRGKFMGLVETGTRYNGLKTGLDHLVDLGVTHVQLLPVYDFATCDGLPDSDPCYNWGYDPRNYNVPEERYSQSPTDYEARAREFKTMVNEFHKAGIRVIMDVVYNHTYAKEMFESISGRYYTPTDLSGTGNSIDADQPMVSRMIQDSLAYWVDEYGVDGFRFDLIGIFSQQEVVQWGRALNLQFPDRNLLLYGEPWNGYASDPKEAQRVRYGTTHQLVEEHVGVFNGAYREALKGSNDDTRTGYMFNNLGSADAGWSVYDGLRGSAYDPEDSRNGTWFRNFAADPEQSINYISAHDNFGLWDKVFLSLSGNVVQNSSHQVLALTPPANLDEAKRVLNFGMGMVLTSQGIPFIHAGDEFLRTKTDNEQMNVPEAWNYGAHGGTHNTYNAPDSFNKIRWHRRAEHAATFNYFKDLIALRRHHAGLRMTSNQDIANYLSVSRPDAFGGQVVTGYITDPKDTHDLFVVYNSGNNQTISLPSGTWTLAADATGARNQTGLSGQVLVEGTAVTVFTQTR
ncbi:alpha-amylase family glycosyl hydrolase [Photobacterium sp. 1_MG-2023]|uniref:alpha-amylase family glycosyl hydrolase n=1 Tax=Photobacterium sp. 1_MG-2023 TaxID=3062646 RepID=UPI0026E232A1|nr:alpha-amylase family glycosyl hydrolase [Photobacterium sp. 1_MG-2023]MDO6707208.1 alpha-amylase family glycosyl hydrolase [Photobacterium sp. 1_MG-2023]